MSAGVRRSVRAALVSAAMMSSLAIPGTAPVGGMAAWELPIVAPAPPSGAAVGLRGAPSGLVSWWRGEDDASDETGVCPNCDSVIALGAAECPVCKAVFGEGSAWEVQSRAAKDGAPYGEPRRPVQSDQPAATASGPQSGVMHRIIPIGIAVAVAPAPLLAFAVLNQSDDLALIASTALFNFTGPLGAVLVAIGILRRALR